jgi:hypothetical protein
MKFLKICFLLYSISIFILPIRLTANKRLDLEMAEMLGKRAANETFDAFDKCCWFGAGMTIIGLGISVLWNPYSPDPGVFVGKSPEYVKVYTYAYKSTIGKAQMTYSLIGTASFIVIGCALIANGCGSSSCDLLPSSSEMGDPACFQTE